MKPKFKSARFANRAFGVSLATVLFVNFTGTAQATTWVGDTSSDWNDNLNWSGDAGTGGSNAIINLVGSGTPPPYGAIISNNIPATPVDIIVGNGGQTGRLDHTGGTAQTGNNNWMIVGVGNAASNGTYNLADATGTGGTYTGMAQGSGSMTVGGGGTGGRLYVGGDDAGGDAGTGVVNVNTSASLIIRNDLVVGSQTGNGTFNLDNGTVSSGSVPNNAWTFIGANNSTGTFRMSGGSYTAFGSVRVGDGGSSNGTLTISGGTFTKQIGTGDNHFIVANGGSSQGTLNQSGGLIDVPANQFWVGQGANTAVGTYNLSAGTLNVSSNWIAVGRGGGQGTINMTGGTINKTGSGSSTFGTGTGGVGTLNQSGGTYNIVNDLIMGENGTGTGNLNLSATAEINITAPGRLIVGRDATTTGNVSLDGGTLRTAMIDGGAGVANADFNGTQIIATAASDIFINDLDSADIESGGLLVNSNGFNLTVPQSLAGDGGVVKSGAGRLSLLGFNTYTGDNSVSAGELVLRAGALGTGAISVADSATLGIRAVIASDQLVSSNVTLGTTATGTTLNLDLGNVSGFNPSNSLLDVTGNLSVAGDVTVNIAGSQFAAADMPLVSFTAANRSGVGNFVLGTLPNGVVATIVEDPDYYGVGQGLVYLDITSVALPKWDGTNEVLQTTTADTTDTSADIIVASATGIVVGQEVRGAGIPDGTTVDSIAGLTITLSQPATATASGINVDFVVTAGTNEGVWDIDTTANWVDQVTSAGSVYKDPNPVLFDDSATGPTAVTLDVTAAPSEVLFDNSIIAYSLTGTGKISGTTTLTKSGTAALSIATENDYTGVTTLAGGTTTVASLTNGGVASPLGAASAAPANLVLAGGNLNYTGAPVSTDRGFTITGASTITTPSNLTLTGQILRTAGGLGTNGAGIVSITNAGPNGLGDIVVNGGGLVLDGTGGPQTNTAANVDVTTAAGTSSLTLTGTASLSTPNRVMTGLNNAGANGDILIEGNSQLVMTGGWLSVGQTGSGTLTVKDSGSLSMTGSDLNISDLANSNGTLVLQGNGSITGYQTFWGKGAGSSATINISGGTYTTNYRHSVANSTNSCAVNLSGGTLAVTDECYWADGAGSNVTVTQTGGNVNMNGGYNPIGRNGTAVWNQSAGTVNSNGWTIIGRDGTGNGTLNISGGTFNQTQADRPLMVGEFGVGTLTVSGTGEVNSAGANGLILANEPAGTGTVNLNGGTLTVRRVREGNDGNGGNGGTSTFNFNGGTLRAGTGANLNFLSGLNSAVVQSGGAIIDSNGQTIAIAQALDDGGGDLTKVGAGTLLLNGANGYFGTTTVQAGTLGGTGSLTGALVVESGGSINPGASAGSFYVGDSATIDGTYVCEIDGANADLLDVAGDITINPGAVLDFNELSAPTAPVYIIANYSNLTGTFTTVNDLPSGYSVEYNYLGLNQIALVQTATPYSTWATGYGLDPLTDGAPAFDKDNDGQDNITEYALGGDPTSGSDNAKIYNLIADGDGDVDTNNELLMTIAVRTGAPAFTGSPSPTSTVDGVTYTIQGSADLGTFTAPVTPVSPVTTGLPAAPAGYEYRTFSLDGSNGLPTKGFLRVEVTY